jgi:thiosulfate reductase electron transport protein
MSDRLIVFDDRKCIRCHSCEVGCQLENDAPPGIRLRWVTSHVRGGIPEGVERSISTACFHCNNPACVSSCPAGALRRRPDGMVEHLRHRCIGCGYCIQSCPFHVPKLSPAQHTMRKCSYCIQRIDYGLKPACCAKCPTGALVYYPPGEAPKDLVAYGMAERLHMVYALQGKPREYKLPDPVPLNTITGGQVWKWLGGLVPGAFVLAWIWKMASNGEEPHE